MNRTSVLYGVLLLCAGFSCALHARHDPTALLDRSRSSLAAGDTASAIRYLEEITGKDSSDRAAFILLGSICRAQGTVRGRLRSQHTLEAGLRRFPDDTMLMFELGKTHFEQTFFPDAARCFRAVLDRDSTQCEAMFLLGRTFFRKWKRNQSFTDELIEADRYFSLAHSCDPENRLGAFYLAFTKFARGDSSACRSMCERALNEWPADERFRSLSGTLYFYTGNWLRSFEEFEVMLAGLSEEESRRYHDVSLLLDDDALSEYRTASAKERDRLDKAYWMEHDPDPTTKINERLIEHTARMVCAELFFSDWETPGKGGITDRGIALIKFGWPTQIDRDLGGGLSGRLERWTYDNGLDVFEFTFVDEFLNDRFSIPIEAGAMKQQLLIKPPEHTMSSGTIDVPGTFRAYSFRSGGGTIESYLYAAVHYGEMQEPRPDGWRNLRMQFRTTVFDDDWKEIETSRDSVDSAPLASTPDSTLYVVKRLELPFGDYRCTVSVEDIHSLLRFARQAPIRGLRFLGSALALSDIVLFESPGEGAGIPVLSRNSMTLTPCVGNRFSPPTRLGVYVEIYNMKLAGSRSHYEVSYFIFESPSNNRAAQGNMLSLLHRAFGGGPPRRPAISQTVRGSGGQEGFESILIDIDALIPGKYELEVAVIDLITGERTARTVLFTVDAKR